MRYLFSALLLSIACFPPPLATQPTVVTVGSKLFTENIILGEIATGLVEEAGYQATHREQLGGTQFLWKALLAGDIDLYPEYTGTVLEEILAGREVPPTALADTLATYGIGMTRSLGFNNTYALGLLASRAESLGLSKISDLRQHPMLRFGFSNEYMDRGDGWPALQAAYALPQADVRGLDHELAYRGLRAGAIDMTDLYSTDAEIAYYNLAVLEDDLGFFPNYEAVYLYRADLEVRAPEVVALLHTLEGRIPEASMVAMNAAVKLERQPAPAVARAFLAEALDVQVASVALEGRWARLRRHTAEHLWLVLLSLGAALAVALPLGIVAAKRPLMGQVILGVVGVIYTIPALALLVFMIPILGIGGPPAMVALFLYSLLPIVRNTHAGITDLPNTLVESAIALGLPPRRRLFWIELPMASRTILAGIKTAAVINIGTATLGALIGAGGYGQPILTGIRLDDVGLILEGAVPAALLALLVQGGFEWAERWAVPKGLRLTHKRVTP